MSSSTPLLYYALYASPFVVAAIVLIWSRIREGRAREACDVVERLIARPETPVIAVRPAPQRRRYVSCSSGSL